MHAASSRRSFVGCHFSRHTPPPVRTCRRQQQQQKQQQHRVTRARACDACQVRSKPTISSRQVAGLELPPTRHNLNGRCLLRT
jgi:hypothetical protein